MATTVNDIAQVLRTNILSGHFQAGEKLKEAALAENVGCSRTLVRLALSVLEGEGLVEREPNRGCRVREFTLEQVTDAILVRGELEGMAARTAAERGLGPEDAEPIERLLDEMDAALVPGFETHERQARWIDLNETFHARLIAASGNRTIVETIASLSRMPLVSSRSIVFDMSDPTASRRAIERAHEDHHSVFEAIRKHQSARAEALMREHALRSAANKRSSIDAMKSGLLGPRLPGINLIAV